MCGILGCLHHPDAAAYRQRMLQLSRCIRHRGPDWSGCIVTEEGGSKGSILCHERLAIVGVDTGAQPLTSTFNDGKVILAVNGEIYNHRALRKGLKDTKAEFRTHSDCEVLLHLYREHGPDFVHMLDGMFSFILLDTSVTPSRVVAARDPIGITTLYQGWSSKYPGAVYFASELKAIHEECDKVRSFPPGHIWDSSRPEGQETVRYFTPTWWNTDSTDASVTEAGGKPDPTPANPVDYKLLRETLEMAVRKRLMSEVPYGVLLSGGLDSSLIAAIAARETERMAEIQSKALDALRAKRQKSGAVSPSQAGAQPSTHVAGVHAPGDNEPGVGLDNFDSPTDEQVAELASWPRLHSFSIGLPGSPDLIAARRAAEYLGTVHHEYTFTVQEGLDAIQDVIYHLETYDVTTVRASTPMYLLSRKIKAMGVKMVLSGEGSDEILGGYLYFHAAPNAVAFHDEVVKRVKNLHTADCLRANKSTMAWGLEARVPFLDKAFLEVAMNVDPKAKLFAKGGQQEVDEDGRPKMEKYILRKAFDITPPPAAPSSDPTPKPYLPPSILWRQKEQFSDGVGYSWIDGIKDHSAAMVSDEKFEARKERYPVDTPDTKEAYWIREIFESYFPSETAARTAVRWIPRGDWGCAADPSGRSVAIHQSAYSVDE
ncbi:hypothetical protein CF326_g4259 [Tilletia indica]|uniref:asparagine synthase (glutamine-hydrolyzing) n=1 Tax=Tilletia indica TaxID=43049 RepID=A0A177TJB2_9BASI|nr:hypothetical protein CF326_g4259 [Tilletia indica]KAE8260150.1 hypothetical protein A4X13_0g520 [Tilletia indica]